MFFGDFPDFQGELAGQAGSVLAHLYWDTNVVFPEYFRIGNHNIAIKKFNISIFYLESTVCV